MSQEIELQITGLVYNQKVGGTYGLVMSEINGNRRFSVMIGEPEAQSIALKMNDRKTPRPLTHDLIHHILGLFEANLKKVLIYDLVNDVFFAELQIEKEGKTIVVDARTSDAVALAVRTDSPIFIKSEIMDIVGTEVDPIPEPENTKEILSHEITADELDSLSKEVLEDMLSIALEEERYEVAVNIRDALNKKKKS